MNDPLAYSQTLTDLYNLQKHGIRPGLERMRVLLSRLDNPHRQFPSIHIGGTNGKGSTAAMVASILKQAGYRVGLYTSPHLIDFTERITLSGEPISQDAVVVWTRRIQEQIASASLTLTFFEFVTALAFCYFADMHVDMAVVEVGLGGRFDATNLLSPHVTAITQLALDHQQYLGETLPDIAREKAGIIKEGVPIITSVTLPEALAILEERAEVCHAPLFRLGREIIVSGRDPTQCVYRGQRKRTVSCPLQGKHQLDNIGVALGIIESLQSASPPFLISEENIMKGIQGVKWPGRLQVIRTNPRIILDGAHNPGGAQALSDFLQTVDPEHHGRHLLMMGILNDKDIRGIITPLATWADEIVLTRPNIERAADFEQLYKSMDKPLPTTLHITVVDAIHYAEAKMNSSDTLVITGSLYTVGEALAFFTGAALSPIRG